MTFKFIVHKKKEKIKKFKNTQKQFFCKNIIKKLFSKKKNKFLGPKKY